MNYRDESETGLVPWSVARIQAARRKRLIDSGEKKTCQKPILMGFVKGKKEGVCAVCDGELRGEKFTECAQPLRELVVKKRPNGNNSEGSMG